MNNTKTYSTYTLGKCYFVPFSPMYIPLILIITSPPIYGNATGYFLAQFL
jgi:hypothetical protein